MISRCNDATRLQDLLDITTVKTRYTRYLDTKRWQDWAELFTEDVTMHMGEGADDVIQGRQAILDLLLKKYCQGDHSAPRSPGGNYFYRGGHGQCHMANG